MAVIGRLETTYQDVNPLPHLPLQPVCLLFFLLTFSSSFRRLSARIWSSKIKVFIPAPPLVCIEPNPGPGRNGYLDEETRWEIVFLLKRNGLTPTQVSKELKISRKAVYEVWAKYQETKSVHDRPKSGRKRKLSAKEEKAAWRAAKRGKTSPQIARTLKMKVSDRTISRSLKSSGLRYLTIRKEEHLTMKQIADRVEYAKEMADFDWKTALFTDEKSFWLGSATTHAWQDPKHRLSREVSKYQPKLHVWGGAGYYMKTKLYFFQENLNAQLYQQILQSRLQEEKMTIAPGGKKLRGKWFFVQDNDPKHRARTTLKLLNDMIGDRVIKHPSNSPDLNPMEDFWSYLNRKVQEANVTTIEGLKKILTREWNLMEWSEIRASVNSMPNRLQECLRVEGKRTHY